MLRHGFHKKLSPHKVVVTAKQILGSRTFFSSSYEDLKIEQGTGKVYQVAVLICDFKRVCLQFDKHLFWNWVAIMKELLKA